MTKKSVATLLFLISVTLGSLAFAAPCFVQSNDGKTLGQGVPSGYVYATIGGRNQKIGYVTAAGRIFKMGDSPFAVGYVSANGMISVDPDNYFPGGFIGRNGEISNDSSQMHKVGMVGGQNCNYNDSTSDDYAIARAAALLLLIK